MQSLAESAEWHEGGNGRQGGRVITKAERRRREHKDEAEIKVHKREWEWNQECAGDESPAEQAVMVTDDDVRQRGILGGER